VGARTRLSAYGVIDTFDGLLSARRGEEKVTVFLLALHEERKTFGTTRHYETHMTGTVDERCRMDAVELEHQVHLICAPS